MQAGDFVCGHIRLLEPLPPGLGSPVLGPGFLALDEDTGTELWLCPIDADLVPSPMDKAEFMAGANGLATARHPDLVRVASVDREQDACLVGYEALPGAIPLQQAVRDGIVGPNEVLGHASALARGLAFLHQRGLVHGLLSASTVVAWEGSLALWQHGLVQHIDAQRINAGYARFARSERFAPEMSQGQLLPASDVYGWATVVAQMVVGDGPAESVAFVRSSSPPEAPTGLVELLRACLESDFSVRPGDGAAVLARLGEIKKPRVRAGGPPPPPPPAATTADELALSLSQTDLMLSEIAGEQLETQRPELRTSEPTARLQALAQQAVPDAADSARLRIDKVLGGGSDEPELTELALEGREDLEPIEGLGSIGLASTPTAPTAQQPHAPRFGPQSDPELALERPAATRDVVSTGQPRAPSGPGVGLMLAVFVSLITGLAGWSVAVALSQRAEAPGGSTAAVGETAGDSEAGEGQTDGTGSEPAGQGEPAEVADPQVPQTPPPPPDCPRGMAPIDDRTCIDIAEAPGLRRLPLTRVTHRNAETACEGRGARLCTIEEWRMACQGTGKNKRRVPYGRSPNPDTCNTASIAGFARELRAGGSLAKCKTPEGVYDLVGNAGEWTAEGYAVGGDSETAHKEAICTAKGEPPEGYSGPDLGYRCCAGR